jgi:hypothetical protein
LKGLSLSLLIIDGWLHFGNIRPQQPREENVIKAIRKTKTDEFLPSNEQLNKKIESGSTKAKQQYKTPTVNA